MNVFGEFNRKYAVHIRNHFLTGGLLLALGTGGIVLGHEPMVIFIALCTALCGIILAQTLFVHLDYEGDLQAKHIAIITLGVCASAALVMMAYYGTHSRTGVILFRSLVLPFLLANFFCMHLPFLVAHVVGPRRRAG
jgi:NADH:ubiquinone oxidoreductase subunit K